MHVCTCARPVAIATIVDLPSGHCVSPPARRIALVNWRTAKDAAKAAFHAQALALGDVHSSGISSAPDGLVGSSTDSHRCC